MTYFSVLHSSWQGTCWRDFSPRQIPLGLCSWHIDCPPSSGWAGRPEDVHCQWRRRDMDRRRWLYRLKSRSLRDLVRLIRFPTACIHCCCISLPQVGIDASFVGVDEYVRLIEWLSMSRHVSVGGAQMENNIIAQPMRSSKCSTCECATWAMITTWHVKGAKQSFSKGVRGWSRFGGCLWPLRIERTTFPTAESGKPPLRLAHPPRSMRCKRLLPPATVETQFN